MVSLIDFISEMFLGKYSKSASIIYSLFPQKEHSMIFTAFLKVFFKQLVQIEW